MKTTTSIKAAAIAILHFTFSILHFTAHGAVIQQVIVRQQWPWSTDVKVEYKLAEVTAPVDISVKAFNGNTELPLPAEAVSGDLYGISESGIGQFIIDPVKAFGNTKVAIADFRVELELSESAANIGEVLYKIFDLENGGDPKEVTRADLLNGMYGSVVTNFASLGEGFYSPATDVLIWTGVTNDVKYKTTHLVMRKIPAKNQTFAMGSPSSEVGRSKFVTDSENQVGVRFTNDYYVAVFELTQKQYKFINNNAAPSAYTGEDADWHPVEKVSYNTLRGAYNSVGPSGEKINWPTNAYMHEVYGGSVMAKLRTKFSNEYEFDLLTEAQWEYACRAKTTTAFNNGKNLESVGTYNSPNLESIAWYISSDAEAQAGNNTTHVVGMKAPNAWGLYDMHGNVGEICLDVAPVTNINPDSLSELLDPPGLAPTRVDSYRIVRGGASRRASWSARSAARRDSNGNTQIYCGGSTGENSMVGVRVTFPVHGTD